METLEDLNGFELKRLLASLQARGLAENTVSGMRWELGRLGQVANRGTYAHAVPGAPIEDRPPAEQHRG